MSTALGLVVLFDLRLAGPCTLEDALDQLQDRGEICLLMGTWVFDSIHPKYVFVIVL